MTAAFMFCAIRSSPFSFGEPLEAGGALDERAARRLTGVFPVYR
jgi:hypothetical protein